VARIRRFTSALERKWRNALRLLRPTIYDRAGDGTQISQCLVIPGRALLGAGHHHDHGRMTGRGCLKLKADIGQHLIAGVTPVSAPIKAGV
jgi:hypothetical protein